MLLCEIYDDPEDEWTDPDNQDTTFVNPHTRDIIDQKRTSASHRYMGAGSNAYVGTQDIDNFGDVHRISDRDEGGALFLEALWNTTSMHNNPYMPRVRSIEHDKTTTIIVSERLIPFDTPSIANKRLMTVLLGTCFTPEFHSTDNANPYDFARILFKLAYNNTNYKYIKDPLLLNAIEFINNVKDEYNAALDIHIGNLMWRMTYPRPQMVIVDPIVL